MILRSKREVRPLVRIKQPSFCPPPSPSRVQKPPRSRKARLTLKNLQKFEQEMGKTRKTSRSESGSSNSKNTTTTDKQFGERLWENGVRFEHPYVQPPKDLAAVAEYLDKERESQPANEEDYQNYLIETAQAENEDTATVNVWPLLAKKTRPGNQDHFGYNQHINYQWTEVDSPVTANTSDPKPDLSEAYQHHQYPPEAVNDLGPNLVPTQYGPAMPSFCVEVKGPDGSMTTATKQAAYDGAVMVDAAWETHKYMEKPADDFLDQTQALTGTFQASLFHVYANHAIPSQADATKDTPTSETNPYPDKLQYHQFPLKGVLPKQSLEDFQKARKMVRNAQDWGREKATKTKDALHAHVDAKHTAAAIVAAAASVPVPAAELTPPKSPIGKVEGSIISKGKQRKQREQRRQRERGKRV